VRGGVAQRGLAVVENVIVRERDERGTCGFEGRHREGGSRSEVVPLVRPARPAIGDATLQVPDQSVEFLKPRERRSPDVFRIVVVDPPLVDAPAEHQVADEPDPGHVAFGGVLVARVSVVVARGGGVAGRSATFVVRSRRRSGAPGESHESGDARCQQSPACSHRPIVR